jgi:predicted molibdopterin-dependent oxidoreductase YjgC
MAPINLTINGRKVQGEEGQTILEAARANGINDIPYLCYHPKLTKSGACRICMVRVNGKALKASCVEEIGEGMVIITEDPEIVRLRKWVLELLLADGAHNCLYCDANGACELQTLVQRYGIDERRYMPRYGKEVDYESSKALKRNEDRCILCGRCVKACKEIQVSNVWSFAQRGSETHLVADDAKKIGESSCARCGLCAQLCPTGALWLQPVLGKGPNWELTKGSSICVYCGVGCKIDFYTDKEGLLTRAIGNDSGSNNGHLCVKGRFGFDFVQNAKRLTTPLIKKDGRFEEATWDEALSLVTRKLLELKADHGPGTFAALSSAKCSNEENYLMQKFTRAVMGTNNIDHCARL